MFRDVIISSSSEGIPTFVNSLNQATKMENMCHRTKFGPHGCYCYCDIMLRCISNCTNKSSPKVEDGELVDALRRSAGIPSVGCCLCFDYILTLMGYDRCWDCLWLLIFGPGEIFPNKSCLYLEQTANKMPGPSDELEVKRSC